MMRPAMIGALIGLVLSTLLSGCADNSLCYDAMHYHRENAVQEELHGNHRSVVEWHESKARAYRDAAEDFEKVDCTDWQAWKYPPGEN